VALVEDFQDWARPKAKYFGVVAAAIVFGAWAVTNFLSNAVSQQQAQISDITTTSQVISRQLRLDRRLGNLEKLILRRTQNTGVPEDIVGLSESHMRMYHWGLQNEFTQAFRGNWVELLQYAANTTSLCKKSRCPKGVQEKADSTLKRISELYDLFDDAHNKHQEVVRSVFGRVTAIRDISESEANLVLEAHIEYYNTIEDGPINVQYISLLNSVNRSRDLLVDWATETLESLMTSQRIFRFLSLSLYVVGTVLAIYGKWLDASMKAKGGPKKS